MDFLSMEETRDAPLQASGPAGARPRSATHVSEGDNLSGKHPAAGARPAARPGPAFEADSSPTVQALPKEVVAAALINTSAKARDLAREAKLSPSFVADSSPTVQALPNDVMGKVRTGAVAKASPSAPPAGRVNAGPVESAAKGRAPTAKAPEKAPDKAADKAPDKAPDKAADKAPEKAPDKAAAKPADKPAAKPADKSPSRPAATPATPGVAAIIDPNATIKHKIDIAAVPNFEADSSPTLKQMPDENLINATRERSRPHNGPMLARVTGPAADSSPTGRATPTLQAQPALISATRAPSTPARPVAADKSGATKPPVVIKPATKPPGAPLPPTQVLPPPPSAVPEPLPASADSPSMGWLAMASGKDPLADAVKQAKEDLKIAAPAAPPRPAALAEPPRPAPKPAEPAKTTPPAAKATPASDAKPSRPAAAPAKAAPIPATAPVPDEAVPSELPPSAESPSMGWLAMASGSSQLEDALAAARADLGGEAAKEEGDKSKPKAARPVRDAGGVVVVNRSTVKAPEPAEEPAAEAAPRAPVRSTQARMPAIQLRTAKSITPQQVLAALSGRTTVEDWQLAQDLGIAPDALDKILTTLEDEGQIRLMSMGDGQRMVVRID
jgi:hypothetical protein